jgi:hypothetical protein
MKQRIPELVNDSVDINKHNIDIVVLNNSTNEVNSSVCGIHVVLLKLRQGVRTLGEKNNGSIRIIYTNIVSGQNNSFNMFYFLYLRIYCGISLFPAAQNYT